MKMITTLAALVLASSNAFAYGAVQGTLECKSTHASLKLSWMNSEADGFAIGEDDDRMTVDGSTSEALVAESKVFPAPSTKQFNIQDEHGVTKIRVRLPVYVDSIIDTPVKATVQVRLRDGRFVSETAVCK